MRVPSRGAESMELKKPRLSQDLGDEVEGIATSGALSLEEDSQPK